jgi:hypothetical protein
LDQEAGHKEVHVVDVGARGDGPAEDVAEDEQEQRTQDRWHEEQLGRAKELQHRATGRLPRRREEAGARATWRERGGGVGGSGGDRGHGGSKRSGGIGRGVALVGRGGRHAAPREGEEHLVERGTAQSDVVDGDATLVQEANNDGELVGTAIGGDRDA